MTARGGSERLEDLTLNELDELRELTGGADPTGGDFWSNLAALYGFVWLIERRADPGLQWETVRGWPLRQIYTALEAPVDPTGPNVSGNGSGSPTPSESTPPISVG
jgi:hypothetical protein